MPGPPRQVTVRGAAGRLHPPLRPCRPCRRPFNRRLPSAPCPPAAGGAPPTAGLLSPGRGGGAGRLPAVIQHRRLRWRMRKRRRRAAGKGGGGGGNGRQGREHGWGGPGSEQRNGGCALGGCALGVCIRSPASLARGWPAGAKWYQTVPKICRQRCPVEARCRASWSSGDVSLLVLCSLLVAEGPCWVSFYI